MGRRYDDRRWKENPDGSFSRIADGEATGIELQEPAPKSEAVVIPQAQVIHDPNDDIVTTGAAALLAEELGVDLSTVTGTGLRGKITKADVEAAAA